MPSLNFSVLVQSSLAVGGGLAYTLHESWNKKIIKTAFGGLYSFNFHLRGKEAVDEWLEEGLGRHIEVYSPELAIAFEGFVNKVDANIGSLSVSRGPFLDVGNKVLVAYSSIDWSTGEPSYGARHYTDWAEDSDSQTKYGVLEKVVSTAGANATKAQQIRDIALGEIKEPNTSESENLEQSSIPSVTMECRGYFDWFSMFTYDSINTGSENASAKLQTIVGAEPNGNIFSTDYTGIDTNTTQVGRFENDHRVAMSYVKGIAALGDAALDRWTIRVDPGRKVIYTAVPTDIAYQRSLYNPRQTVERYGDAGEVRPWNVEPGNWLFYTDFLIGKSQPPADFRTDPRYVFIEETTYREPWSLTLKGSRISRLKQLLNQFGVGGYHA